MATTTRSPLPSLTGLRAPAAYAVFVYHMQWLTPGLRRDGHTAIADLADRVAIRGYVGVSFFFILSGFVLAWSHRPGEDKARFWWKRAVRVYPNHIVTWAIAAALIVTGVFTGPPLAAALLNLLLLPHVLVPGADWTVMNNPSWSIEVEAFFYALFPFLLARLGRLPDRRLRRPALVAGGLAIALPLLAIAAGLGDDEAVWRLLYFFPVSRVPEFVIGMTLGLLARRSQLPVVDTRVAWVAVVVGFAACTVAPIPLTFVAVMLVPFALLIVAYAGRDIAGRRSRFGGRVGTHLGATSYAFYACHDLIIRAVSATSEDQPLGLAHALALTAVCFALSLTGAEVLHRLVEAPAMRYLRERGPGRQPVNVR